MARSQREGKRTVRELYELPLNPDQVGILHFGFSAILLRTAGHVIAFDLGLFTIRRREIAALRRLDA